MSWIHPKIFQGKFWISRWTQVPATSPAAVLMGRGYLWLGSVNCSPNPWFARLIRWMEIIWLRFRFRKCRSDSFSFPPFPVISLSRHEKHFMGFFFLEGTKLFWNCLPQQSTWYCWGKDSYKILIVIYWYSALFRAVQHLQKSEFLHVRHIFLIFFR